METGKYMDKSESRRNFLKIAGKFAVYTPPALIVMSNANAKYIKESIGKCNNGFGNGDQCAPGNSLLHNNAENSERGNPNVGIQTNNKLHK